jgi:hypothetical protein
MTVVPKYFQNEEKDFGIFEQKKKLTLRKSPTLLGRHIKELWEIESCWRFDREPTEWNKKERLEKKYKLEYHGSYNILTAKRWSLHLGKCQ